MATLATQTVVNTGLEATFAACAAGGDAFPNDGRQFIWIVNASVGDITLTIATQNTIEGLAVADRTVIITAAEQRLIGPFAIPTYNDTNGRVVLTYSGVVTLTIAIVTFTPAT